jgi:hypothetical protein
MTERKPIVLTPAGRSEMPAGDTFPVSILPLRTSLYKLAINATYPGGVDAMFQSGVIVGNEGGSTMIVWREPFSIVGGLFDGLVSQWLQLPVISGGQGLTSGQAATAIVALRVAALSQTI